MVQRKSDKDWLPLHILQEQLAEHPAGAIFSRLHRLQLKNADGWSLHLSANDQPIVNILDNGLHARPRNWLLPFLATFMLTLCAVFFFLHFYIHSKFNKWALQYITEAAEWVFDKLFTHIFDFSRL